MDDARLREMARAWLLPIYEAATDSLVALLTEVRDAAWKDGAKEYSDSMDAERAGWKDRVARAYEEGRDAERAVWKERVALAFVWKGTTERVGS